VAAKRSLNAADEVAVAAFLEGKIAFSEIPESDADVLKETSAARIESISQVLAVDAEAQEVARN